MATLHVVRSGSIVIWHWKAIIRAYTLSSSLHFMLLRYFHKL